MLKEKELDWDQKQSIQDVIENAKKEILQLKNYLNPLSLSQNKQININCFLQVYWKSLMNFQSLLMI
ncbi:MAG: hypothetical protein CM15mP111_0070 [Hyphomicrobiales bacterium]|nr:MAG: hypothetical protein CM15mP111_0070 [Hyphomicrobiales bacterium]